MIRNEAADAITDQALFVTANDAQQPVRAAASTASPAATPAEICTAFFEWS
jgi:hypothetical protein